MFYYLLGSGIMVFFTMILWSKKYQSGFYNLPDATDPVAGFLGYLFMGALPMIGIPILLGEWLHKRDVKTKTKQKELETVQGEVRAMLGE